MDFNRVSAGLKKGANWLFNNNGNQIDPTRIRLTDATPIHTTGLTRLRYSWDRVAATAAPVIAGVCNDHTLPQIAFMTAMANGLHFYASMMQSQGLKLVLGTDKLDNYCINKKPQAPSALDRDFPALPIITSTGMSAMLTASELSSVVSQSITQGVSLPTAIQTGRNAYNMQKLRDGHYTIEKLPPPSPAS